MSDHRTHEARFGALLDGDLEADQRAEMEAHLASCAQCAAAWHSYAADIGALRFAVAPAAPPAHVAAVMARVRATADPSAQVASTTATAAGKPPMATAAAGSGSSTGTATGARPKAILNRRTIVTHVAALAAGVLATIVLASVFGARETPQRDADAPRTALDGTLAGGADVRNAAERAAARRESERAAATALAAQQTALARALVERATADTVAQSEALRTGAAALTLASTQLASARDASRQRYELEREAHRHEAEREAQMRETQIREGEHLAAAAARSASTAAAAVALARSFERFGETLAQHSDALVARHDARPLEQNAPSPAGGAQRDEPSPVRDWRAIEIDSASLAATGRRAEHVTIRRDGDRVALSTSGALDEIVDALLVRLDDPDPDVRAAVERRLDDIAAELGVARGRTRVARESADEPWWRSDRGQVAALAVSREGDAREPWPAWWSRARAAAAR